MVLLNIKCKLYEYFAHIRLFLFHVLVIPVRHYHHHTHESILWILLLCLMVSTKSTTWRNQLIDWLFDGDVITSFEYYMQIVSSRDSNVYDWRPMRGRHAHSYYVTTFSHVIVFSSDFQANCVREFKRKMIVIRCFKSKRTRIKTMIRIRKTVKTTVKRRRKISSMTKVKWV